MTAIVRLAIVGAALGGSVSSHSQGVVTQRILSLAAAKAIADGAFAECSSRGFRTAVVVVDRRRGRRRGVAGVARLVVPRGVDRGGGGAGAVGRAAATVASLRSLGTFGALAAVTLRGLTNDVYFQIGLVTLLGLAAKNAILIVEYAVMKKHEGLSSAAAAVEAARLRFRPILMTSLAFILGVMPLAFSTGAGAGARHSAGTGVMGGMLAATFLAIFFIPWFFKLIVDRKLADPRSTTEIEEEAKRHREAALLAAHGAHHHPVAKGAGDAA